MFNRNFRFNKKRSVKRSQLYLDMLKTGAYGELRLFWPDDGIEDRLNGDQWRIYAITYDVQLNKYIFFMGLSYREAEPKLKQEVSLDTYEQALVCLLKKGSARLELLGYKTTSEEEVTIFTVNALKPIKNEIILNLLGRLPPVIIYPWRYVPVQEWVLGTEPYQSHGQTVPYWYKK
jgi:hypothetical protein